MLTAEEERALVARMQAGDARARDRLVLAHRPLARRLAAETARRSRLEFDDLESAAVIGLIRAADAFDPERGARFSTVAKFWVRSELLSMVTRGSGAITVPENVSTKRTVQRLPRVEFEVATEFPGLGREEVTRIAAERLGLNMAVVQAVRATANVASLDAPVQDEGGATLVEFVADDAPLIDEALGDRQELEHRRRLLAVAVNTLPPRTRDIYNERIVHGRATLDECGAAYGISRERVRQIERAAIEAVTRHVRAADRPQLAAA